MIQLTKVSFRLQNYYFFCKYTKNVVPFSDVWKHIFPPLPSTMFFDIGIPSPAPVFLVVKFGTKIFSCTSAGIPGPLSEKDISIHCICGLRFLSWHVFSVTPFRMMIISLLGLPSIACIALRTMFVNTCVICSASAYAITPSSGPT